jgi:hypothetical protein
MREATNDNFVVFNLARPDLQPTIYRTRGERYNYYTANISLMYENNYKTSVLVTTFINNKTRGVMGLCVLTRAASGHLSISLVMGVNPLESLTFILSRQL